MASPTQWTWVWVDSRSWFITVRWLYLPGLLALGLAMWLGFGQWKCGFPDGVSGKEPTCQCKRYKRRGFNPWVRKIPWRRAWQPTPVFLPRESHGQRNLTDYSPWGCKELDTTEETWHSEMWIDMHALYPRRSSDEIASLDQPFALLPSAMRTACPKQGLLLQPASPIMWSRNQCIIMSCWSFKFFDSLAKAD